MASDAEFGHAFAEADVGRGAEGGGTSMGVDDAGEGDAAGLDDLERHGVEWVRCGRRLGNGLHIRI